MSAAASPVQSMPAVEEARDVSFTQFRETIVPAYRPIVLRGAVRDWPAVRAGAGGDRAMADYLLRFDCGAEVTAMVAPASVGGRYFYRDDMRGVNFEQRKSSFRTAMTNIMASIAEAGAESIYVGSSPIPDIAPGFGEENQCALVDPIVPPRLWVGGRSIVAPHYDLSDNIACCVHGERRFTFFPPDQVGNLYVSPLEFTLAGQPCSMVDLHNPDFERYPRFHEALKHAQTTELEPGDAVYIPYLWWHHVESLSPLNVLINYWWTDEASGCPEAFEALVHAILAVRHNPPNRREAWKTIFDHYVFEANGDPAAHLPPIAKGVLSPMSPKLNQFVRNWLLRVLSGGAPPR